MNKANKNIILGIVIILIIGAIYFIESSKPSAPSGTGISIALPPNQSATSTIAPTGAQKSADRTQIIKQKSLRYPPAVEIIPGGQFINSQPFKLQDLIGKKVILVDFWTYTCINCLRTLPYLEAWDAKYKDQGLVIVGIHSPEFDFEKDYNNVLDAVKKLGVKYPVVQDNNHTTWDAYQNQYWPAEYLIDIDGYITDTHFGEGSYAETEQKIQAALKERDQVLGLSDTVPMGIVNPADTVVVNPTEALSPETYFGAGRNEYLGNGTKGAIGVQQLSIPSTIKDSSLYLDGEWNFQSEFAKNTATGAKIVYKYNAKNVYLVARADIAVKIAVLLDGKLVGRERGTDVSTDGTVIIKENRLYKLIQDSDYREHTLEIIINNSGLEAYTFTFG